MRLGAGVAAADDDDVKFLGIQHALNLGQRASTKARAADH